MSCVRFGFQLITKETSIRAGLWDLVEHHPALKVVLMGQRRTDPACESLDMRALCDVGWPDLVRCNPLLNWSYADVWELLQSYDLEYCCLYDQGYVGGLSLSLSHAINICCCDRYTSIGDRNTTVPNPLLLDSNGQYKPAYLLDQGLHERSGRSSPAAQSKIRTAALMILGDEILNGRQTVGWSVL